MARVGCFGEAREGDAALHHAAIKIAGSAMPALALRRGRQAVARTGAGRPAGSRWM